MQRTRRLPKLEVPPDSPLVLLGADGELLLGEWSWEPWHWISSTSLWTVRLLMNATQSVRSRQNRKNLFTYLAGQLSEAHCHEVPHVLSSFTILQSRGLHLRDSVDNCFCTCEVRMRRGPLRHLVYHDTQAPYVNFCIVRWVCM